MEVFQWRHESMKSAFSVRVRYAMMLHYNRNEWWKRDKSNETSCDLLSLCARKKFALQIVCDDFVWLLEWWWFQLKVIHNSCSIFLLSHSLAFAWNVESGIFHFFSVLILSSFAWNYCFEWKLEWSKIKFYFLFIMFFIGSIAETKHILTKRTKMTWEILWFFKHPNLWW